jgi:hypothetical protein
MQRNRPLYHPDRVRAMFAQMRSELHAMHFKHLCELADLRRELDETRTALDELRAATLARQRAEADLELLRRDQARRMSIAEGRAVWLH